MVNKDYHSSNGTECINNIALHQAQLVVRWVIIHVYTILVCNQQLRPTQSSTLVGMWWSWSKFELSSRLTPFISYTPLFQAAPQNTPLPSSFYYSHWHAPAPPIHLCDYTHNRFTALWKLSRTTRVSWYQKVHYAIFWIFWSKMKITQTDAPTVRMDCHFIQTNWCPTSAISTIFTQDALPYTSLPIYPGLGQAPNKLACIPGGLVTYMSNGAL